MLMTILNVIYVLLAIAMIALILMQRGSGAQAGSGFGGGASATVFGSRGASNFLSKTTKWMAIVFFAISLFMAWQATRNSADGVGQTDLGVMAQLPAADTKPQTPAPQGSTPTAPPPAQPANVGSAVPAAPPAAQQRSGAGSSVPNAPPPSSTSQSAAQPPQPQSPAPPQD